MQEVDPCGLDPPVWESCGRPPPLHQLIFQSRSEAVVAKKVRSKDLLQFEVPGTSDVGTLSETAGLTGLGGCFAGRRAKSDRG